MPGENILIVDDEPLVCKGLERELTRANYYVDTVLGGAEAVSAVQRKQYDVVLIDKNMPGMDGIETCRQIKNVCPDSACIFMTGLFDKENILKEMAFVVAGGRTYYLYKPFSEGEVLDSIQKVLGEKNK